MTDWTQKLKAIEAKAEGERRAHEAQTASDHADYVARMSAINHVLQDIVSPALDELKMRCSVTLTCQRWRVAAISRARGL